VAPKKVVLDPEDLPHMSATITLMEEEEDRTLFTALSTAVFVAISRSGWPRTASIRISSTCPNRIAT
jgi:hypothetical protein